MIIIKMDKANIVIIPGLNSSIDIWKITNSNQESVYSYLKKKYNVIDLVIPISSFKLKLDDLLNYMDGIIPNDSFIISNSFGSVSSLLYTHKYDGKIKGLLFIDPTTSVENYRFNSIDDIDIRNNLFRFLEITESYKNLKCPIISHSIIPFKKLMNPDKSFSDTSVFSKLNKRFMYLQFLSNNPKSSIIIHPNRSHFLQQNESDKIKNSIDTLVNFFD